MIKLKSIFQHPLFWLFILVLLVYWPLTFQVLAVPFDMTNCWVPWRHYISDTIQNGEFPWWHPYQQMGYPIHADLQGPTWHLESLVASLWGTQGIYYIQWILLGYIYLGAVGFYKLSSLFTHKKWLMFLGGAAYVCSAFFTSHTMHFFAIISAAFVPFILYHFIQMFEKRSWQHAIWCAVFVFFNLTGGNQTFTIISFYLLLAIAIRYAIVYWREGKSARLDFVRISAVFGVSAVAMGSIIFTVFLQVKPYLSRLSHLNYESASVFPFPPMASSSFLNPMATINDKVALNTDGTMANAYFGLLCVLFFIGSFARKNKDWKDNVFLVFALLCLVASFGNYTPLHHFLYEYVPLLGKFRFPSYYVYFFMICAIPMAIRTLDAYMEDKIDLKRMFLPISLVGLGLVGLTVIGMLLLEGEPFFLLEDGVWFDKLRQSNFSQNAFFYGLIQVVLFGLIIWTLVKKNLKLMIIIAVIDLGIGAQPNLMYIGVGKTKPSDMEASLHENNNPNPIPSMVTVRENIYQNRPIPFLWQNVNHLPKIIGPDGFNSNYFSSLWNLMGKYPQYADRIFNNPFVYYSYEILPEDEYLKDTVWTIHSGLTLIKPDHKEAFSSIVADSPITDYPVATDFGANFSKIQTNVPRGYGSASLNYLQSYYPGWKAYIDGEETEIYKTNVMFMSIVIPEGEHLIEFKYFNRTGFIAALISYITFFGIMLFMTIHYFRKNRKSGLVSFSLWGFAVLTLIVYLI